MTSLTDRLTGYPEIMNQWLSQARTTLVVLMDQDSAILDSNPAFTRSVSRFDSPLGHKILEYLMDVQDRPFEFKLGLGESSLDLVFKIRGTDRHYHGQVFRAGAGLILLAEPIGRSADDLVQDLAAITSHNTALTRSLKKKSRMLEKLNLEKGILIQDLQKALSEVKTLSGLLPICSVCKNIRDDQGYWNKVETYIGSRSTAEFTHSYCPDCIRKMFPEQADEILTELELETSKSTKQSS